MEHVEVGGLRIAYRRAGDGSPLVLLHGGLSDSREWRRQLEDLSDEFTVVAGRFNAEVRSFVRQCLE